MNTHIEHEITELEHAIHALTDKWRHEIAKPDIKHLNMQEWRYPVQPDPFRNIGVNVMAHSNRPARHATPIG